MPFAEPGEFLDVAPFAEQRIDGVNERGFVWADPRDIHSVAVIWRDRAPDADDIRVEYWHSHWPEDRIPRGVSGAGSSGWGHEGDWYNGEWRVADTRLECDALSWTYRFAPIDEREFDRHAIGDFAVGDLADGPLYICARPTTRSARQIRERVVRRQQLLEMTVAEKNRRHRVGSDTARSIGRIITALEAVLVQVDKQITQLIHQCAAWREQVNLLETIRASARGQRTSSWRSCPSSDGSIAARSPRSSASRHSTTTAAPSGVNELSGADAPTHGACCTWPRSPPGSGTPSSRRSTYDFVPPEKPFKVALLACMRKLLVIANTIAKNNEPWYATT